MPSRSYPRAGIERYLVWDLLFAGRLGDWPAYHAIGFASLVKVAMRVAYIYIIRDLGGTLDWQYWFHMATDVMCAIPLSGLL